VSTPTLGAAGAIGDDSAVSLDDSSQYTQRLSPTVPVGSAARSIELWFKTTSTATQALVDYGSLANAQQFALFITGSTSLMAWGWGGNNDKTFTTSTSMTDGKWHQIVETYSSGTLTAYLDGASLGTRSVTLNTVVNSHGFNVGVSDPGGTDGNSNRYCACTIDEVSVYASALSAARVQAHYRAAGSLTTAYAYDAIGNLSSLTDPLGHKATYAYDDAGRLTTITDPLGNLTGANPTQHQISYTYDADGNQTSISDQLGHTTSFAYDRDGRRISSTDPLSRVTGWTYNALDQLTQTTAPDTSSTTYAYDQVGNLTSRTDANNHATSYAYDSERELTSITDPLSHVWSYSYDADGNRTQQIDAIANAANNAALGTTTYSYDHADRATGISYSDGTHSVAYSYDAADNLASMTDGGGTVSYSYDNADRLTQAARGTSSFTYAYDARGNLTSLTYPDTTQISYGYDAADHLTTLTSGSKTTSYAYDANGRLTTTTLPSTNGYAETRSYDNAGWLATLQNAKAGTTLSSFSYTRDAAGEPTTLVTQSGTELYSYDSVGRLSKVCYQTTPCGSGDPAISWTYDPVGNRATQTRTTGATSYSYNAADQLTATTGLGAASYSYDADGRQTAAGASSYQWNLANQLTQATVGSSTTSYTYDGNGERLSASSGSSTTNYLWNEAAGLDQLALEQDGSGNLIRRYTYGAGDAPATLTTGAGSFYYLHDGLGSTANLTSATGATEWSYSYEPYGLPRATTQNDPSAPTNPIRFTGQYLDPTGLYNLRARQYDPTLGAFLSPDPAPLGPAAPYQSAYEYGNATPTSYTDPGGERAQGGASALYDPSIATGDDLVSQLAPYARACLFTGGDLRAWLSACTQAAAIGMKIFWQWVHDQIENHPLQTALTLATLAVPGGGGVVAGERIAAESEAILYRAVSSAERADIQSFGGFRQAANGLSNEAKLFATSAEDAARYGRINYGLDNRAFHIVEARVSRSFSDSLQSGIADRMRYVSVDRDRLNELNRLARIKIWNYVPWVTKP